MANSLCSSIPVPIANIFGSNMISEGSNFTSFNNRSYARLHIATFSSVVSACPFSSKAITITAAPNCFI